MGGAGGSYWAICWLFYVQLLFIRHSGPRLYPLIKSVGTKLRFCLVRGHMVPTKTSVGPKEVVRLEVLRLPPPLQAASSSAAPLAFSWSRERCRRSAAPLVFRPLLWSLVSLVGEAHDMEHDAPHARHDASWASCVMGGETHKQTRVSAVTCARGALLPAKWGEGGGVAPLRRRCVRGTPARAAARRWLVFGCWRLLEIANGRAHLQPPATCSPFFGHASPELICAGMLAFGHC
jgi:hypothetical protein